MGCYGVMMFLISKFKNTRSYVVVAKGQCADINGCRKGELVTSEKGKTLQEKAWKEMTNVLRDFVPPSEQWLLQS
jgi:hypothetical protein